MHQEHDTALRVVREWMERIWQAHDLDAIDALHTPDFVDHSAAGRAPDNAAYRAGIAELYAAFPDWRGEIEDLFGDPQTGKVAMRWSGTGTHTGVFLGHPPTGRVIQFVGIEIVRVADGRIAERWGEWDGLALLDQLGEAAR
jgi:steroid delta-isomerase-like uncharacterized protein